MKKNSFTKSGDGENKPINIAFESIIANMPGHVYWKDRDGVYLGCNNRQAKSLGFDSGSEVIGKTDFELPWKKDSASLFRQNDIRIMETEETEIVEEKVEINGTETIMLSQKTPLRNDREEVVGILGISIDITARKIEEEKHRLEKEKAEFTLAYIIEHLPGHVYWKNKASIYQGCNLAQAKSAGFTDVNDIIGKTDYDMPWCDDAEFLRESDLMVMNSKQALTREERSRIADSEEASTFLSKKVPFLNQKEEVIGILGISIDISDRKKMEAELHQAMKVAETASRAKSEFIANMSHDIRTPLTGILNMSASLQDKLLTLDGEQEAQWLNESGEQLLELCNGILDSISAENYTEQDVNQECFDLRQLLEDISQLEMPGIKSKGLDFKMEIDAQIPPYLVNDRIKLHRILVNLLGNAIKFTKAGYVSLAVKMVEKKNDTVILEFSVADTGIGIKPELQDKVFERFFRVNPSYKGLYSGYGLGLYIAQKYLNLIGGGRIRLKSEEGQGTCFFFEAAFKKGERKDVVHAPEPVKAVAPRQDVALEKKQPSWPVQQASLSNAVPYLLLIEDDKIALRCLEALVTRAGCQYRSAPDGEHGVTLAATHNFDLIISDVGLPGISGIEVATRIRSWEKLQGKAAVPIIGLTGHALQQAEQECLQAGMNKVLAKPSNLEIIQDLIRQFIPKDKYTTLPREQAELFPDKKLAVKGLGVDLPDTEAELFALQQYLFFDMKVVKEIFGEAYVAFTPEILQAMAETIPVDKEEITRAFMAGDWQRVQQLAHRIKGGAASCGTIRLRYACQYLERYRKAGHSELLEKLYYQLIQVMDETKSYIEDWLKKQ